MVNQTDLEYQISQLTAEKKALENNLERAKGVVLRLNQDLEKAQAQIDDITAKIDKIQIRVDDLTPSKEE